MKLTANKKGIRLSSKQPRKESWLPDDEEWLNNNQHISRGSKIGEGCYGAVYKVKNNSNLVVKTPIVHSDLDNEVLLYNSLNLSDEPLMIPTKIIKNKNDFWLIRPRLREIGKHPKLYKPTNEDLEQIRRKLIDLSRRGLVPDDGLQLGIDRNNRVQLFDLGGMKDVSPDQAFTENNYAWMLFLKIHGRTTPSGRADIWKYGTVSE